MFKKLRLKIGEWALKKELRKENRKPALTNLKNARVIGVVAEASSLKELEDVKLFLDQLAKQYKQVYPLVYMDVKKIPETSLDKFKNVSFFCRKDLNYKYIPVRPDLVEFIGKEFEVLIDLSLVSYFPVKYIMSVSKARLKVARLNPNSNPADILIDISKRPSVKYLTEQIDTYLDMLTNNK